jgi:hypothetical protein
VEGVLTSLRLSLLRPQDDRKGYMEHMKAGTPYI